MKVKLFKHIVTKDDIKIEESLQQFKKPSNIVSDNLNPIIFEIKKILPTNPYEIEDDEISLFLNKKYKRIANKFINIGFINFSAREYSNKLYTPQDIMDLYTEMNQKLSGNNSEKLDLNVLASNYIASLHPQNGTTFRTLMVSPDLNYIVIFYNVSKYKKFNEIIKSTNKFYVTYASLNEIRSAFKAYNKTNESIEFKRPDNIIGDNFTYSYIKDLVNNNVYTGAPISSKKAEKFLRQYKKNHLNHHNNIVYKFDEEFFDWTNNNHYTNTSFYLSPYEIIEDKLYVFIGEFNKPRSFNRSKAFIIYDAEKNKIIETPELKESSIEFKRPNNIIDDNLKIKIIINDLISNGIYTDAYVTDKTDDYLNKNFSKYCQLINHIENDNDLLNLKKLLNIKNFLSPFVYVINDYLYVTSYLPKKKRYCKYYRYVVYDSYNKKLIYKNFLNESTEFKRPENIVKDNTFYNKFIEKFGPKNSLNHLKYNFDESTKFLNENGFTNDYETFKEMSVFEPKNIIQYIKIKYNINKFKHLSYSIKYNIIVLFTRKTKLNDVQTIWFNIDSLINDYENFILNESTEFKRPDNIVKDNTLIQNLKNKNIWTGNIFNGDTVDYMKKTNAKLYNTLNETDNLIQSIRDKLQNIIQIKYSSITLSTYIYELIPNNLYLSYYWDNEQGQWYIIVYDVKNNKIVE